MGEEHWYNYDDSMRATMVIPEAETEDYNQQPEREKNQNKFIFQGNSFNYQTLKNANKQKTYVAQ